jgi:glycosyltransferase involved in cell wall biosynthesis
MSEQLPATPLVTIGVPVYNSERHLRQSLDSLLAQTYRDFVLVISDNASTDGTAAICQEYVRRDPRVRYFRNPVNIGMTGNFNRVFELTNTKYIKWSTADDYWAPEMLADAVAIMEADPSIVVCYPQTTTVDDEGNVLELYRDRLHLMHEDHSERFLTFIDRIVVHPDAEIILINHHLGLLRCDVVRRTQLFGKHVSADIGFLAEMSLYGKFFEMPKRQMFRRFHVDSSSWNRGNKEQEARRFHPSNRNRLPFSRWRFHAVFSKAVARSSLSWSKKVELLVATFKVAYWFRKNLYDDLRHDIPFVLGVRGNKPGPKMIHLLCAASATDAMARLFLG